MVVVNKADSTVICTDFSNGKCHDFRLFKESKVMINKNVKVLADTGFQGINKFHKDSKTPKKKTKKNPLTESDKANNRKISSERVQNEHAIGFIKRFRILSEKYRNRPENASLLGSI